MNTMMEEQTEMMNSEMPEMMKANLAGEMEMPTEEVMNIPNALMGVVKNQINDLEDEIDEADKAFARAHHNDKYSKATYDAEETCKLLNAQRCMLNKVLFAMEDIMTSKMPISA